MGIIMHKGVAYGGGGIDAIADASDVNLSSPADGQFLKYDGTAEKWVNAPISAVYHAAGSKTVEQLLPALLIADNEGCVYNMSNSGETTTDFVEGDGYPIREGDNVGIVNVGTVANPVYKFDLLSGFVDLSDYYDSDTVDELLDDKANTADLGDLASIDIDGSGSTKFLRGDGTWQNQAAQAQSDWAQTDNTQADYIKNKPTIPTVGDGTITIQKNGTSVDTFTTNQSSAKTINITMAKSDVGLDNVPNVTTDNQTPTVTEASTRANIASGDTFKTIVGKIKKFFADLKTVAFTGSYNDLTDKPTIPSGQVQSDWSQTTTTAVDYIKNKPTIPAAQVNSDWNASSGVAQILNKPTIPAAQIQSDWNQTTTTAKDYIKNKPTIPSVTTKYDSSDTAETTLADDDKIPFYDTSASGRRNSTWANIKAKLKSYFDGIYSTFSGSYNDLTNKPTIPASLDDLSDVVIYQPQMCDHLRYDSNTKKWYTEGKDFILYGGDTGVWTAIYSDGMDDVYNQYRRSEMYFTDGYSDKRATLAPSHMSANVLVKLPPNSGTLATQEWANTYIDHSGTLTFSNSSYASSSTLAYTAYRSKGSKIVSVSTSGMQWNFQNFPSSNQMHKIATGLPKPLHNIYFALTGMNGGAVGCVFRILTNGELQCNVSGAPSKKADYGWFSVCYLMQ